MTKLDPTIGKVNVVFPSESEGNGVNHQYHHRYGIPIRFIPIETLLDGTTGQVGWHGSTWEVYKTKTGRFVCALCEWSCADGDADHLSVIVAESPKQLFQKLDGVDGTAASRVRGWLAETTECVETI